MSDDDYMSYFFHMGEKNVKKKWAPYKKYTDIKVTYKSSNSSVVAISKKGKITLKKPGSVTLTAKVKKTKKYKAAKSLIYITVLPDKEGLYTDDVGYPHFYYQKKQYMPGTLPRETEIRLCKSNPHLKKFLEEYLPRYRTQISNSVEAGHKALYPSGEEVKLTDLIHLQMESEYKNPEIYPAFRKADQALQEELKKFYEK